MTEKNIVNGKNMDLSELVYIIDRSGSMGGLESDTIGGFNASLKKNQEAPGDAHVSVLLFDNEVEVVADRQKLSDAKPLDNNTYYVRGCTALLDAVGGAIKKVREVQGYMPDGHKAGHVIFTIITDGYENASTKYDYAKVKDMIEASKGEGWEFIFLGANIDAAAEASRIGIGADRSVTYHADAMGTAVAYEAMGDFMAQERSRACCAPRVDGSWSKKVKKDFFGRRK